MYRDVLLRHHSSCNNAVGGQSVRRLSSAAKESTKTTPPDVPEQKATPSLDGRPNVPDDWMFSDSQSTFMPADVSLAGFTAVAESADEAERGRSNANENANGKPEILSQPIRTINKRGRYVTKAW